MVRVIPDARFFGFTGTPIKKNDHDTYKQFGLIVDYIGVTKKLDEALASYRG